MKMEKPHILMLLMVQRMAHIKLDILMNMLKIVHHAVIQLMMEKIQMEILYIHSISKKMIQKMIIIQMRNYIRE